ncbi:hypothetical protein YC2023_066360 [Brassica napus]
MGGGAWAFLVGGAICLVNSVNERDLNLLTSYVEESLHGRLLRGTMIIAIVGLQRGIPSKRESSARVDYVNLQKDHCRNLETERLENDETSLSVGWFLTVPADSVVMRSPMPKTSVLVGSYAYLPDITKPQNEKCQGKCT